MNEIGHAVIMIGATGMLCGLIRHMVGSNGMIGSVVKLVTGILLLFVILNPILNLDFRSITQGFDSYAVDAKGYVENGATACHDALSEGIKQRTRAYIMQEAKALNLDIMVDISVSGDDLPIPNGVTITGKAAPYAKEALLSWIAESLNISREALYWK